MLGAWIVAATVGAAPLATAPTLFGGPGVAQFTLRWSDMLLGDRFDELEKTAALLRRSHATFPNGQDQLWWFYDALAGGVPVTKEVKAQIKEHALKWAAERPSSVAAQIVRARILSDQAWAMRGSRPEEG